MSIEPEMSHDACLLLDETRAYVEESERERRTLRGNLANVRALLAQADDYRADLERQLAAAEKRAEEAEARLQTQTGRVHGLGLAARNLALATPDRTLRAELERCARLCAEAEDVSAPTQPQEPEP